MTSRKHLLAGSHRDPGSTRNILRSLYFQLLEHIPLSQHTDHMTPACVCHIFESLTGLEDLLHTKKNFLKKACTQLDMEAVLLLLISLGSSWIPHLASQL